jgi:hypothetical protein
MAMIRMTLWLQMCMHTDGAAEQRPAQGTYNKTDIHVLTLEQESSPFGVSGGLHPASVADDDAKHMY